MCRPSCFVRWSELLALADGGHDDGGLSRRRFLGGAAVSALAAACSTAPSAPAPTSSQSQSRQQLLNDAFSFDLHSHPGLFPSLASNTLAGHRQNAETGRVKMMTLTATSDSPVLAIDRSGRVYATRQPAPGELHRSMYRQIDTLTTWSKAAGLPIVMRVSVETSGPAVRAVLAVEGCDFLEGRVDRVQEAYDRGIRSLQLVHYRVNEIGDIQTEAPVHGGLTPFGKSAVQQMNKLGIVVDVAHATYAVVRGVADTTTQPLILSHSNIQDMSGWARFITKEHAKRVADTGGVIGAMPIMLHQRAGDNVGAYVKHVSRLVDAVGVDHVGIGTDMDGIGPSAIFTSYARWPSLADALRDNGYKPDEVAKILGGNAQRVYQKVAEASKPPKAGR